MLRPAAVIFALCCATALAGADRDDWAFQPLSKALPPVPATGAPVRNPVDAFVLDSLQKTGLKPSPEADRASLIRRLSFDLVGLPPSPEEIAAFEKDRAPGAYERLADRLLASPRHGERWARHWLDVVRFGESQGFEYDRIRDDAWPYRDYVIRALNDDKRYDDFVREQIAGDVMQPVSRDGVVATGFLVAGPWDQAGNSSASAGVRAATREAELEDIVGTVGQTFLGLTVNCARCHDHKFDPIPQRDYYSMKAVFQGVRHGSRSSLGTEEKTEWERRIAEVKQRVEAAESRIRELEQAGRHRALEKTKATTPRPVVTPYARWTFDQDASDETGNLPGTLEGGAKIRDGRLVLDGKSARVITRPLAAGIAAKTLEAWVALASTDQRGGGVLTLENSDGRSFDSIVYGERKAGQWMAGSEFHRRTLDLDAPPEKAGPGEVIHIAIVYREDRSITLYRNGRPLAPAYVPKDEYGRRNSFPAGARILIGQRHTGGDDAFLAGEVEEARLYNRALSDDEVLASFKDGPRAASLTLADVINAMTPAEQAERQRLLDGMPALQERRKELGSPPSVYAAVPEQPGPTFVLRRGEPGKETVPVAPAALSSVAGYPGTFNLATNVSDAERRLSFARWVADPGNPLTARTLVNRVWHYHFGRGLVVTPNDFGKMGGRPTHPELLDWLAGWFVSPDGGAWSLKRLHRLIVTSATYRQSAAGAGRDDALQADPENALLWRMTPRRLDSETLRDTLLVLGGELEQVEGGPSFQMFRRVGNGYQNEYLPDDPTGPGNRRRTVYRMHVHSARNPFLDAFDCPEFSTRTAARPSTTTPLQALSMMNNPAIQRTASDLAARLEAETRPGKERLTRLWLTCLGRRPTPEELREAGAFTGKHGLPALTWSLLNTSEFLQVP